ncbi:MAG: Nucleoside diphosphate kinase [Candidatus Woesebacteria bacterium GW2011_GWA2_40_7]|uniref:nucleoside-diphosphate kinase n=3 Tax=Candidatus Woeseibacteriota TaxID=1752722 RepID=A0A0G0UY34_9BACT|nr:MAG: Nucleoside diphosphate kinase [Candidatus Woesebacteria bacterium GW2011_GWB1_39_10]KKR73380.1 MAG: Nucleoside diphosphate kinase [Candidatus Woesebacteria bacterium GW2011_GWA2_40_7]KKR92421.1 MAG: Nucleoside diphosphate kinase [Candidatus Woesebacteria bacterium GW2011_GWA1_41_13b]
MKTSLHERTLVLIKPDGVQRGLIGEILTRFEKKGLKIIAMRMAWPDSGLAQKHYDMPESDKILLGERTIASYKEKGVDLKKKPVEIAENVQKRLVKYLTTGPVVAMVIEGAHAIQNVRKIRGATNPLAADVGTITADYTIDSYFLSDPDERAIRNLVHASGSVEEANREIDLWFKTDEINDYELAIEKILYSREWEGARKELTQK